ncbi:AAA family ATPase [Poritiphilus flavus]|uniref:AAA family ATPase n=1 Tax=Poritiphilus flavus TaxID=2697053 RepID=A0A6L9EE07_9FLAO|nr:ATP-binding protein [Poritiphilus flavus]NAS12950.1 AAA family ATPase [Poritiphilus flavus]
MKPKRIAITGGPGSGKTSIVNELETNGFYCFHEIIRTMTMQAKKQENEKEFSTNPLAFVSDPYQFNQKILQGRITHFEEGAANKGDVVFYDRGIPDVLAYMDYFSQPYEAYFEKACEAHRYDMVLIVPPWKEIYISDNERLESYEEALQIHRHLEDTYSKYGYQAVVIPKGTVAERTAFVLNQLKLV